MRAPRLIINWKKQFLKFFGGIIINCAAYSADCPTTNISFLLISDMFGAADSLSMFAARFLFKRSISFRCKFSRLRAASRRIKSGNVDKFQYRRKYQSRRRRVFTYICFKCLEDVSQSIWGKVQRKTFGETIGCSYNE